MSNIIFNWTRYWTQSGNRLQIDEYGFVYYPERSLRPYLEKSNDFFELNSLCNKTCLVLLGEPGIGKSTEIIKQVELLRNEENEVLLLELKDYSRPSEIYDDISEWSNTISDKTKQRHLFLDGLDEYVYNNSNNPLAIICRKIGRLEENNIFLRISCKSLVWQQMKEELTCNISFCLKNKSIELDVYELCALGREEIANAAEQAGIKNPDDFISEIIHKQAAPFAVKPLTLMPLIDTYKSQGALPDTKYEIYKNACLKLCEETRRILSPPYLIRLSSEQKLIIAARIAAFSVFSNINVIHLADESKETVQEKWLKVEDIYGGQEKARGNSFDVNENKVLEALNTGLFSSFKKGLGFSHQSHREFLAAYYLIYNKLDSSQLLNLLFYQNGIDKNIPPQLYDVACWLAEIHEDIYIKLLEKHPEILIDCDIESLDDNKREMLFKAICNAFEDGRIRYLRWGASKLLKRLKHNNIIQNIKDILADKTLPDRVIDFALDVASPCGLVDVSNEIVQITLDEERDIDLRVCAAYAMLNIGVREQTVKLRPLVDLVCLNERYGPLKSLAIEASWPEALSTKEMFQNLLPHDINSSTIQLFHDTKSRYREEDMLIALEWINLNAQNVSHDYFPKSFFENILSHCLQMEQTEPMLDMLTDVLIKLVDSHCDIFSLKGLNHDFNDHFEKNVYIRRAALKKTVRNIEKKGYELWSYCKTFYRKGDIHWLIDCLQEAMDVEIKRKWAEVIHNVFNIKDSDEIDLIIRKTNELPLLKDSFEYLMGYIDLDSEDARKQRQLYKSHYPDTEEKVVKNPNIELLLNDALDCCESGKTENWVKVLLLIAADDDVKTRIDIFDLMKRRINELQRWKTINEKEKDRVKQAAINYIYKQTPKRKEDVQITMTTFEAAGYIAFVFLQSSYPEFIGNIKKSVWEKWGQTIVICNYFIDDDIKEEHIAINKRACVIAKKSMYKSILTIVQNSKYNYGNAIILRKLDYLPDMTIYHEAINILRSDVFSVESFDLIIQYVYDKLPSDIIQFACDVINEETVYTSIEHKERAAEFLFSKTPVKFMEIVIPVMRKNNELCRMALLYLGVKHSWHEESDVFNGYTSKQLADLYILITIQFPHEEEDRHYGAFTPNARDKLATFRGRIYGQLLERGAAEEMARIVSIFPQYPHLKSAYYDAQQKQTELNWNPIDPKYLLDILKNNKAVINNETQLLNVVVESLKRLQKQIKNHETSAIPDLWNNENSEEARPKDELRLSDRIKRHLQGELEQSGIIVNREVEISGRLSGVEGQEPDIKVEAFTRNTKGDIGKKITLIIEVKGCWNKDVYADLKGKLAGRYLEDKEYKTGLYVVGWFNCEQWNCGDWRRNAAFRLCRDINETKRKLEGLAQEASKEGKHIESFVLDASFS